MIAKHLNDNFTADELSLNQNLLNTCMF